MSDLIGRLQAMYSHRGDGIPTQFINPDGPEAADLIERQAALLGAILAQGKFLLDRIDQLEWSDDGYPALTRDWLGHVDPALDRFRSTLAKLEQADADA